MPKYYKLFRITGVANAETLDTLKLTSTKGEPKRITAIWINLSGYADNNIKWYIEREKIGEMPDYFFDTEANDGNTNTPYSTTKAQRIPVEHDIKVGDTFEVSIECGATAKNVRGVYEYEIRPE